MKRCGAHMLREQNLVRRGMPNRVYVYGQGTLYTLLVALECSGYNNQQEVVTKYAGARARNHTTLCCRTVEM